jgi:hypothetical protein
MSKMSGESGMMPQAGKPPAPYCEWSGAKRELSTGLPYGPERSTGGTHRIICCRADPCAFSQRHGEDSLVPGFDHTSLPNGEAERLLSGVLRAPERQRHVAVLAIASAINAERCGNNEKGESQGKTTASRACLPVHSHLVARNRLWAVALGKHLLSESHRRAAGMVLAVEANTC